jgi:hypothetical protein
MPPDSSNGASPGRLRLIRSGAAASVLGLVSVREKQGEEPEGRLEAKGREESVFVHRGCARIKTFSWNAPSPAFALSLFFRIFLLSIFLHALDTGFLLCWFI